MSFWEWLKGIFGKRTGPARQLPEKANPPPMNPTQPIEPIPTPPSDEVLLSDKSGHIVTTAQVLALTQHFEGLVLVAEDDGYGTPTVGYGRITYPDGRKVRNGDRTTPEQATDWLLFDLWKEGMFYVRAYLKDEIEAKLTATEMAVWVDLCFNRGCGRFREHIAPLLNAGKFETARVALTQDIELKKAGGSYNLGLHRRRWAERLILEGQDWRQVDSVPKFKAFLAARGLKAE